jgi:hypothetical protein
MRGVEECARTVAGASAVEVKDAQAPGWIDSYSSLVGARVERSVRVTLWTLILECYSFSQRGDLGKFVVPIEVTTFWTLCSWLAFLF